MRHTKGLWALVVALIAVSACGPSDHAGRQFPVPPPDSYSISTVPVSLDGSPEQLEVATVSREFFKGAGVRPFLGRFKLLSPSRLFRRRNDQLPAIGADIEWRFRIDLKKVQDRAVNH